MPHSSRESAIGNLEDAVAEVIDTAIDPTVATMRGFLFVLGLGFGLALPTPAVAVVTLDSRNFEEETNGKTVFIK